MNPEERLRHNIRRLVDEKGTKLAKLAAVVGRSAPWASMYLKGTRPFPFERLDAVAAFFGRTADAMLADAEAAPAASRQGSDPALAGFDGEGVAITPAPSQPDITIWLLGPPEFIVTAIERAAWNRPLVDDADFLNKTAAVGWNDAQLRYVFPILNGAWNGTPQEAYFTMTGHDDEVPVQSPQPKVEHRNTPRVYRLKTPLPRWNRLCRVPP